MKKEAKDTSKIKKSPLPSNNIKKKILSFFPEHPYIYSNKGNSYLIHSINVKNG